MAALRDMRGRINVMRTDMPFCAPFLSADPPLSRGHMLVLLADPACLPSFREVRRGVSCAWAAHVARSSPTRARHVAGVLSGGVRRCGRQ